MIAGTIALTGPRPNGTIGTLLITAADLGELALQAAGHPELAALLAQLEKYAANVLARHQAASVVAINETTIGELIHTVELLPPTD